VFRIGNQTLSKHPKATIPNASIESSGNLAEFALPGEKHFFKV